MFCSNCGNKLIDNAKFCNVCGTKIVDSSAEGRKTTYDGEIHKCPNCGDTIDAYETVCEACGYEIRGRKAVSVVHELALKLENTDSVKKKEELIRNFYIPNTKEDIHEFFILAISNIDTDDCDISAWYAKLEQAYQKARLSFGNSAEFQYLSELYNKAKKQKISKSITRNVKKSIVLQSLLLGALGAIMMIVGFFGGSISGDSDSPFYMIAMIGLFPLMGAFGFAISGGNDKNNKD